jgi:cell wall-associated NlpC family hydrolase
MAGPPEVAEAPLPAPPGDPDWPEADELVATALALKGAPYRHGGTGPDGFDCSGFIQYVFARHGVALPREVREQFRAGDAVDRDALATGDLLFFATDGSAVSHVAILVGDGEFVHAPSERGVVRVEHLATRYWSRRFVGARRVL